MSQSSDYWLKRQDERLNYTEKLANRGIEDVTAVYDESLKRVEKQMQNILKNYAKDVGLTQEELTRRLTEKEHVELFKMLRDNFYDTGTLGPHEQQWIKTNYLYRYDQQEALKLQLEAERTIIANQEKKITSALYSKTIDDTYKSISKDLTGKSLNISNVARDSMLQKKWVAGKNYSDRVWNNTGQLRDDINNMINSMKLTGLNPQHYINELRERYDVAQHQAARLIRTESNYFANQAELESYKDLGIEEYTYSAVRDNRTSEICNELDGKTYKVANASPRENYPPMHPNCRSTTVPNFKEIIHTVDSVKRFKNPFTRESETTDFSYEEWIRIIERNALIEYNKDIQGTSPIKDEASFVIDNKMSIADIVEKISDEEARLINYYTGTGFRTMNRALRSPLGYANPEHLLEGNTVSKAISKFELANNTVLYRGVEGLTLEQINIHGNGQTEFIGLTSTSISIKTAEFFAGSDAENKIILEIFAPKGTKGLYVKSLSEYKGESEFLIPHKTVIDVVSIEESEGIKYVKARVKKRK